MKRRVIIGCPECGDQRVDIADVTIRECLDTAAWSYRSRCPKCKVLFAEETTRGAASSPVSQSSCQ
jgi:predicted Zn-ribbon and HTH transcriptional regulator